MSWKDIVKTVIPFVLAALPQTKAFAPLIPVIINGITEAEDLKNASGKDKKEHVLNLVALATEGVNTAAGKTVIGATAAQVAASQAVDTAVAVANLIDEAKKAK